MADSTGTGTEPRAGPGPDAGAETARVRAIYDRTAHRYDKSGGGKLPREGRAWLARQVEGATLEVGCGTGRNLEVYPSDIALTGIELSPAMLAVARARAERLGRGADLHLGDGQALPFANESFDTVVFCLSLCSIPDAGRAFGEGVRVLRPGGRIVALEHVRSPHLAVRALERLAEPFTVRFDGDHLMREPLEFARTEGLEIRVLERFWLGLVERLVAVKPSI